MASASDHQNPSLPNADAGVEPAAASAAEKLSAPRGGRPPVPHQSAGDLVAEHLPSALLGSVDLDVKLTEHLENVFRCEEKMIIGLLEKLQLCDAGQECTRQLALKLARKVLGPCKGDVYAEARIMAVTGSIGVLLAATVCEDLNFKRAVNDATAAVATLAMQVQLERPIRERGDTYVNFNAEFRELYHSLQPGWLGRGKRRDVPKDACYVAHHGHTYVWVTPDHLEQLTNLTIAIVDVATASL